MGIAGANDIFTGKDFQTPENITASIDGGFDSACCTAFVDLGLLGVWILGRTLAALIGKATDGEGRAYVSTATRFVSYAW